MELPTYFSDFLKEIRPTKEQRDDAKNGHKTLRKRLLSYDGLASLIISTFLQGSYRRATLVRPDSDDLVDVDVIVVTNIDEKMYSPQQAMNLFIPFLDEFYPAQYEFSGRSIKITLTHVKLDLVITSAPSEVDKPMLKAQSVITDATLEELDDWRLVKSWVDPSDRFRPGTKALLDAAQKEDEWKLSPLRIPDREAKEWDDTHPLEQIKWTWAKNKSTNTHYVNVVKALKWCKRINYPEPKYPKGYPLEHIIGQCCPDDIASVASGVTMSLENFVAKYEYYAGSESTPFLPDHGVPAHNVLHRVEGKDFSKFYSQFKEAAKIARSAIDPNKSVRESAIEWKKLFGDKFPDPPESDDGGSKSKGGYSERTAPTVIPGRRFA